MRKSLHSASVFAHSATHQFEGLATLKERVDSFDDSNTMSSSSLHSSVLLGASLAITTELRDSVTARRLADLRPGMWVRLRNVRIDKVAQRCVFTVNDNTGVNSSSSSSSSSMSSFSRIETWVVGQVYADTHVSVILPYFR